MSKLLRDLGFPSLLAGILISNIHYLVLLVVLLRFFFVDTFPSNLDRTLLLYIIFSFLINFYVKRRRSEQRRELAIKARARRKKEQEDQKVANE